MCRPTPETVLVTGGGGFLGSAVARLLAARGDRVSSFSRGMHPELARHGVAHRRGDITDAPALARACEGVDVVFHTAAKPPPWGPPADYRATNVTGTENVIAACRTQGVKRLIHTSTPSVIFDGRDMEGVDESAPYPARWESHYAATKAAAEQRVTAAAAAGLAAVVLRPHQVWGPGDPHFVPRILARARRLKRIGDGTNLVDTTYIDNAAAAHLLAADRLREDPALSGRIYFISQGEPIPAWEMIDAILAAAGRGPVKGHISHRTARFLGWACEGLYRSLRLPGEPPMTRFVADALARAHWFDISAARRDLGYTPAVSTAEGLRRLTAWFQRRNSER
ncbi:MAG: NAD-dependent epimerase/dehydratase family protein [Desulfobacterales bacterium]|nr:NAD-dependent epimerase/dehydratase family protein [Desulfobacterales bacterium]